jgi:fumarylacetoacetase
MTNQIDETHDPKLESWIDSANDPTSDFPIQNLPFGVFRRMDSGESPRIGMAIGDAILDVKRAVEASLLEQLAPETRCALAAETLNGLLARGRDEWKSVRVAISHLLSADNATLRDNDELRSKLIVRQDDAAMLLPTRIGDYTDFYASIHHATNVGSMFRPDNPLMPNYKHLPVGYHGRASSVVIEKTPIRRPMGQTKADDRELPTFGPCRLLDYELEMGFFTGPGNEVGRRISMAEAAEHLFGMCIVNDWSARDIQKWEYQPLGPFNAKNFATSISPWVVTLEALAPFRVPGPHRDEADPPLLDYLQPTDDFGLDIIVEVYLSSKEMRRKNMEPVRVSRGNFRDMYWTIAQMLVHHSSTGCNIRPGDLMASGTVSGRDDGSRGCLLEMTWRGQNPIDLPDGAQRKFLQDGDEVVIRAHCERDGFVRIGFGECRGAILPAE